MKKRVLLQMTCGVLLAAACWFVIFIMKPFNFWFSMSGGVLVLAAAARLFDRRLFAAGPLKVRHIAVGVASAIVLYLIFYAGNILSAVVIPMKDALIGSVYENRAGTSPAVIAACLLLIIGPGEELFWRGYIQKNLAEKYGVRSVAITAFLYAAVHAVTGNIMLVLAALTCGLFWGALYYKEKSLFPVVISHALWDVAAFLLFPFTGAG